MLRTGWLWADFGKDLPTVKMENAAIKFTEKFGRFPAWVEIHPETKEALKQEDYVDTFYGIGKALVRVYVDTRTRPNYYLMGHPNVVMGNA